VAPGSDSSFVHTGLPSSDFIYYTAWCYGELGNRSDSVRAVAWGPFDALPVFQATPGDQMIHLNWTVSLSEGVESVVIRYSTEGFPGGPEDGEPLPNGNDGCFAAAPGTSGEFTHQGLINGQEYYYGGFVHFSDPSCFSSASTYSSTPEEPSDEEPPALSVSIMQNPYLTKYLDLYLVSSEELLPESVSVHVGGVEVTMELADPVQQVWRGDYMLDGPAASVAIVACGCDSALNRACEAVSFAAGYVSRTAGGVVLSPDGAVRLEAGAGAAARDAYIVLVPESETTCLSGYHLSPEDVLCDRGARLEFSYGDLHLEPSVSPDRLYIEQVGAEPLACYVDADRQRIVATVRSLGTFRLVSGDEGSSSILDPEFLRVEEPRPNPFDDETRIRLEVRARQNVSAMVYDAQGRAICELLDGIVDPGLLDLSWYGTSDKNSVPSGIYFLEIRTERRKATRKMVFLR